MASDRGALNASLVDDEPPDPSGAPRARCSGPRAVALAAFGAGFVLGATIAAVAAVAGTREHQSSGGGGGGGGDPTTPAGGGIAAPVWSAGATFNYSVLRVDGPGNASTPQLVQAVNVGEDPVSREYTLASDFDQAVQHAVLNGFPFFGRVTARELAVYEGGVPQPLFGTWPIDAPPGPGSAPGPGWAFRLFETDWRGELVSYDPAPGAGAGLLRFRAAEQGLGQSDGGATLT